MADVIRGIATKVAAAIGEAFAARPRLLTGRCSAAGGDQTGLVGEHDRLDAITQA